MIADKFSKELSQLIRNANELEAKGKIKEAIAEYERIIKLNPNDGNIYNHFGDLCIKINRAREGIEAYLKGIEIFRNDNFFRNALGICKKVLRYDPGNLEINLIIAKLLIELDEKSDASIYLFSYIERQMAAGNKQAVLQAMEYLKELRLSDNRFADKIVQIYEKVGEPKMAEKVDLGPPAPGAAAGKPRTDSLEIDHEPALLIEERPATDEPVKRPVADMRSQEETATAANADRLDASLKNIDRVMTELRKAIRLDEVIIALDKSLGLFSQEQTKTINLFHKSLTASLEALQKSIVNYQRHSEKSAQDLDALLKNIGQSLAGIGENQKYTGGEITRHLEKIGASFNDTTARALIEVKTLVTAHQQSTDDMIASLNASREFNQSLVKGSDDIRLSIQGLASILTRFISAQETKEKRLTRNIYIIIGIIGLTSLLVLISLFVR